MVSPGLGVVAVGSRAWEKSQRAKTPRFYFDWQKLKELFPSHPPYRYCLSWMVLWSLFTLKGWKESFRDADQLKVELGLSRPSAF